MSNGQCYIYIYIYVYIDTVGGQNPFRNTQESWNADSLVDTNQQSFSRGLNAVQDLVHPVAYFNLA